MLNNATIRGCKILVCMAMCEKDGGRGRGRCVSNGVKPGKEGILGKENKSTGSYQIGGRLEI